MKCPDSKAQESFLVIGFGNELRSDDSVGPRVARLVAARGFPGVDCLTFQQLTPELGERISHSKGVIFVDAQVNASDSNVSLTPIGAAQIQEPSSHHCNPNFLLWLSRELYHQVPEGWMLSIPIQNVDFGEQLSPQAQANLEKAVEIICSFIREKVSIRGD